MLNTVSWSCGVNFLEPGDSHQESVKNNQTNNQTKKQPGDYRAIPGFQLVLSGVRQIAFITQPDRCFLFLYHLEELFPPFL